MNLQKTKIKVLFADDSALMRREVRRIIENDPSIEVVGLARNGQDAVDATKSLQPDVVLLDINMPVLDGLTALQMIMMESPRPVIMLSSLTQKGAITTYEALELGAIDFIPKPGGTISLNIKEVAEDIIRKIKAAANGKLDRMNSGRKRRKRQTKPQAQTAAPRSSAVPPAQGLDRIVVIGQSTGGPNAIMEILPHIPANFPAPIVVIQHMPSTFTGSFARRLNDHCAIPFKEIERGDILSPGHGYLAPGDIHCLLAARPAGQSGFTFRLSEFPKGTIHTPSVDVTMNSILEHFGARTIACLLTGMGADGAETMAKVRQAGGRTIAESEETAVVFGMPKEAIRMGGAEFVLPIYEVGPKLVELATEGHLALLQKKEKSA